MQLISNEKFYKGHFDNIEHVKDMITKIQKELNSNLDPRNEKGCLKLLDLEQKRLIKLESWTPNITEYYEKTKKHLESLR